MWHELRAAWCKEWLLLRRDVHGLALLFAMPAAFILIMSLAMDEEFKARAGERIAVLAIDQDRSAASQQLLADIERTAAFTVQPRAADAVAKQALRSERKWFALTIEPGYAAQLAQSPEEIDAPRVTLTIAADAHRQTATIFAAVVREAVQRQQLQDVLTTLVDAGVLDPSEVPQSLEGLMPLRIEYESTFDAAAPTAVQQSVPAWLVFAMFFVAIPLSTALIQERQLGTLRRLRSTPMRRRSLLLGKLLPYFAINQCQAVTMLLIGMYLVPLLGGSALQLRGSIVGLVVMSISVSLAALGFALLVAAVSRTTEQATMLGGAGSILLGALGGVMVPKLVMPAVMQQWTVLSPMAWGLEGWLQILLREGDAWSIWPYALALAAIGAGALILAVVLHGRRVEE